MSYEIPAGTNQLIKRSGELAQQFKLLQTTPVCLLLSTLEDVCVMKILKDLNIDTDKFKTKIEDCLQDKGSQTNISTIFEEQDNTSLKESFPNLDEDSSRIIKLLVLEDKLAKGEKNSSELMLLALMHDRKNEAKDILSPKNKVNAYEDSRMAQILCSRRYSTS